MHGRMTAGHTGEAIREALERGAETNQIRDKLIELVKNAPAGGLFHDANVIPTTRNEFWMEIDGPNGQEFLVTITHTVTKPRGL